MLVSLYIILDAFPYKFNENLSKSLLFVKKEAKTTELPHFLFKKKKQKAGGQSLLFNGRRFHLLPHPERKIKTHEVAFCSTRAFRFASGQATAD